MQDILLPARFTTMWDLVAVVKEIQNIGQPAEAVRCNLFHLNSPHQAHR